MTGPQDQLVMVVRLSECNADAIQLLQEYYEAVDVVVRDAPEAIQQIVTEPASGIWLAYMDSTPVGCVVLKRLGSIPFAGECKRLYVRPQARGLHIADKLLDAQEEFARTEGLQWIYLDSFEDLKAAIGIYEKRGYVRCECYNDNPQATVFLRKRIQESSPPDPHATTSHEHEVHRLVEKLDEGHPQRSVSGTGASQKHIL